jgi:hypothetical protein
MRLGELHDFDVVAASNRVRVGGNRENLGVCGSRFTGLKRLDALERLAPLSAPSAETLVVTATSWREMRCCSGAPSADMSCETRLLMSSPEPMPFA